MRRFCPPKPKPWLIHIIQAILPFLFRFPMGGLRVYVDPTDLERLKAHRNKRMLLLPNHPALEDPCVMFFLAKALGESFYYVAARELFRRAKGFYGFIMQRVGVYSVIRGSTDRESFITTKNILIEGWRRLVIFIEGEISHENDMLIPLEPGVLQLAFWAQEEIIRQYLAKEGRMKWDKLLPDDLSEHIPSVHLVPVAIKYFYEPGVQTAIDRALTDLENAIFPKQLLEERRKSNIPLLQGTYYRLREIGRKILEAQERRLSIMPGPDSPFQTRIETVKNRLLQRMESFLGLPSQEREAFLTRIRAVRNRMDQMIYSYDGLPQTFSAYDKNILEHQRITFTEFYDELARLLNFMTLNDGYLQALNTVEREVEVIRRLEQEVFGRPMLLYPRTAVVKIGEIISLKERFFAYRANKKQTAQSLAGEIEAALYRLLYAAKSP